MKNRNTNTLHNVACPKCANTDAFEVGVRAFALVRDEGAETYRDPEWEDDAPTTCKNCGYQGEWSEFTTRKPYSTCTGCGSVIYWDGQNWVNDDGRAACNLTENHRPLWLTLGEFRDRTAHLPDWMPITAMQPEPGGWYNNLHLGDVPEKYDPTEGETSLILGQSDDMDTRQW